MTVAEQIEVMKGWPQDEPVFVLRGQDELAEAVAQHWCVVAVARQVNMEKVSSAFSVVAEMGKWNPKKMPD